jgi:hypothetical protein
VCGWQNWWSADEVGASGLGTPHFVFARRDAKRVYALESSHAHCTMMFAYNAAGQSIPPLFLFMGKEASEDLLDGASPGAGLQLNDSAWMTEDVFYQWLQFFTARIAPARPALLIVDNHTSRFSSRIVDYCRAQQLEMLLLPANATHLMQPGDVAVHAPLKKFLAAEAAAWQNQHPCEQLTRRYYARLITNAAQRAFSPANVVAGYAATGIYPTCPERVHKALLPPAPPPPPPMRPLSELLALPTRSAAAPSTVPLRKRRRMPVGACILTSDVMQKHFTEKDAAQKAEETAKAERAAARKRKAEEKAARAAASAASRAAAAAATAASAAAAATAAAIAVVVDDAPPPAKRRRKAQAEVAASSSTPAGALPAAQPAVVRPPVAVAPRGEGKRAVAPSARVRAAMDTSS